MKTALTLLLSASAVLGQTLPVATLMPMPTDASATTIPSTDSSTATTAPTSMLPSYASSPAPTTSALANTTSDINTLNYALTLENLEHNFYVTGLQNFTQQDFIDQGYGGLIYTYMTFISAHEAIHVATITDTIASLGGVAVPPCAYYNWTSVTNVTQFLTTSWALESTGNAAYNGAINTLTNPTIIQVAASISSIEARQSAWLGNLLFGSAFVNKSATPQQSAFDEALKPLQVKPIASGFLDESCPDLSFFNLVVPRANLTGAVNAQFLNVTTSQNDLDTLQYALTLEYLESAFYKHFVGFPLGYQTQNLNASLNGSTGYTTTNVTQFANTTGVFSSSDFASLPNGTWEYIQLISAHEDVHVSTIRAAIIALGGSPITPCVYDWSTITTPLEFIKTAATLEQTGSSAYDGAANTLTNDMLLQVAATIATIEARHSFVLNNIYQSIVGGVNATEFGTFPIMPGSTFNDSFEPTLTPTEVVSIVKGSGLLLSCPSSAAFSLPMVSKPTNATAAPTALPTASVNGTVPVQNITAPTQPGVTTREGQGLVYPTSSTTFQSGASRVEFGIMSLIAAVFVALFSRQ